jgi:hypothetical protein
MSLQPSLLDMVFIIVLFLSGVMLWVLVGLHW